MATLLQFLILFSISISILADCDYCYTGEPQYGKDTWSDQYGTPIFIAVICRHGARNPILFPPVDQNNTHTYYERGCWKEGPGQLTSEGKCQAWEVGKWLQNRTLGYMCTIPYRAEYAEIDCSRCDRSDVTCQLIGRSCFNDTVEVRTQCPSTDNMLEFTATCNEYQKEKSMLRNNSDLMAIWDKYNETMNNITKYTGWNGTKENIPTCMDYAYYCLDTMEAEEKCSGVTPDWAKNFNKTQLRELALQALVNRVFTKKMQKLRAGALLWDIISLFYLVIQGKQYDPTLVKMYICHDMTMVGAMHAMGMNITEIPPTASCLIFELRKKVDDSSNETKYFVTIGYRNSTTSPPILLLAKELDDFKNDLSDVLSENWNEDCGNDSSCDCTS